MTKNLTLQVNPKEYGLEEKKAIEMVSGLSTTLEEREVLKNAYIDVIELEITEENLPTFKDLRLRIRDNRTKGIEKWHKANKAFYLAGGRFVDAIKNKETLVNEEMESKLMEAEKHFENLEKEKLAKLQEKRVKLLSEYVEDAHERDLANMDSDVWEAYLSTKKQLHLDKLQAEKEAEEKRIAEAKAEEKRIKEQEIENAKLKAEAEKREKEIEKERSEAKRIENLRIEKENKERKEREEKEKKERELYEAKLKKEREAKEKIEREEKIKREKLEAELKAKKDAELKAIADEELRIQTELNKGDSDKVKDLVNDLKELKSKYVFKSAKNKKMYEDVNVLIDKVINFIV